MKLSPPLNSKSGFTLVEVLVAVAISGIFMVFLIEIFYGQTRLTSNQQENRSFIQLTALIQLLINNDDTCTSSFRGIDFAQNPPVIPILHEIDLKPVGLPPQPLVHDNKVYGGNLFIKSIQFTGLQNSKGSGDAMIPPPPGTPTSCVDPASTPTHPTQIIDCTANMANIALTAYTQSADGSTPTLQGMAQGKRILTQNFPLVVTVSSLSNKIVNCGSRFPAVISPQLCFDLGKPNYHPNPSTPGASWCN